MKTRNVAVHVPTRVRLGRVPNVYFVTLYPNGEMEVRPRGSRKPEATAVTSVERIYTNTLLTRAKAEKPTRRRKPTRGLLSLERRSEY